MTINFSKYHSTGNDFVILDNRNDIIKKKNKKTIRSICQRRFGVGSDGLILLQNHKDVDFEMLYFNADGALSTLSGNGARCVVSYAKELGIIDNECKFIAADGEHTAIINGKVVKLKLCDVNEIEEDGDYFVLNTGSPNYVTIHTHLDKIDVSIVGKQIRNNERFKKEGINVNFVEIQYDNKLFVRTYERGVENETLSCGTGIVASAIAVAVELDDGTDFEIATRGGNLNVSFERNGDTFSNIWLEGPVIKVYEGQIKL